MWHTHRIRVWTRLCLTLVLVVAIVAGAQEAKVTAESPAELVRAAVAREVAAANDTTVKHMFRSRKQTPKGTQTRLHVETNDAMAAMLIAINDKPINEQQRQSEEGHLAWLMNNPDQLRKKRAREKEDADRTLKIVKALPDAFRYEYVDAEPGTNDTGKPGDQLVKLKFTPNPVYSPPSRVEQVLTGMQGYVLVDATERRLARIDGTLFRDVSFGWGIIGHLDKGGHFRVQQADVENGAWEITAMSLRMTGRILMFKGFSMVSDETLSDFQRIPADLTFAEGVDLLKTEEEKMANAPDSRASGSPPNHQ